MQNLHGAFPLDILWFKDLANLARTGHFSQAAELSNISQPAFSRRIKAVESWVGVPLVDRSRHPVALTSAGMQMLEAGRQALERLETEREQIIEAQSLPENYVVTFGAQHSIGWRFYPSWLQAFENAFGPIISRLRADDLPNCLKDLQNHDVDFVIAYASAYASSVGNLPGVESILIGRDALIPVCRRQPDGSPLFELGTESATHIPYLRFGASAPISRHIEPLLAEHDLAGRLGVVYENSMAGALRIRARDGAGVAWLPRSLVAPDLESGLLTVTGDPAWEIKLEIRLHRLREHTNKLTRAIWAFLSVRETVPMLNEL
jgi:DNA-binding transcriptional LysR family regulator